MNVGELSDWYVSGKEIKRMIHSAGFNSVYSCCQYFGLNHNKMRRWLKLDVVPDGRVLGIALIGVKQKAQLERVERELAALKQEKVA